MGDGRPPSQLSFALSRFVHRELIVLATLCVAAAAGFFVTRVSASAARDLRVRDARVWYARGVELLDRGDAAGAVKALGHARSLDRTQQRYHLGLARALIASGQPAASRQILLSLRNGSPEDPSINLALADLEAATAHHDAAVRYYQNALYGAWTPDQIGERTALRRRVIAYLIAQGMQSRAVAQLLLLEGDVPDEPEARQEIADLFLRAGDPARALANYRRVLARGQSPAALAGAAHAAFALGDFDTARRYLGRGPASDASLAELREMTAAVLAADPLARGVSRGEQTQRLAEGAAQLAPVVAACRARVDGTPAAAALDQHAAALATIGVPAPRTRLTIEQIETGIGTLARAASALPPACAPFDRATRAWMLIGRAHQGRIE